jgi:hypothetical protein
VEGWVKRERDREREKGGKERGKRELSLSFYKAPMLPD